MCLSYYKIAHPFQQVSIRSFCRPLFERQQRVYLPPVQRCAVGGEKRPPWKGDIRHDMACALPPPGGGGKRGIRHRMVSYPPLNSPSSSFKPRLPAVARLNAMSPQGRLVLQGYTLDGSGAFRSGTPPPCTGWPRTVMRGGLRKVNSGPDSVSKSARRTEPSPRIPRFAARPKGVAVQRKVRGVKRGQETIHGVLSPFVPAGEHRLSPPPDGGNFPSAVGTASPPPDGGNFYDGRQFPSFTQVVS